jgi:hypothetical protein
MSTPLKNLLITFSETHIPHVDDVGIVVKKKNSFHKKK